MKHVYVQMEGLKEIEAALGMTKDKSKMILRSAINDVAKKAEKDIVKETGKRYQYHQKSDIKDANDVTKATTGRLAAYINMRGPRNERLKFFVSPSAYYPGGVGAPEWIKGRIRRGGRLEKLHNESNKGFVVQFRSGHYAVVARVRGKRMNSNPQKEALQALLSVSTPKAEETSYRLEVENEMYDRMAAAIQVQAEKYLSRGVSG